MAFFDQEFGVWLTKMSHKSLSHSLCHTAQNAQMVCVVWAQNAAWVTRIVHFVGSVYLSA
jgi:hypothetical protein